jgi:hypothetical protein
MIRLACSWMSMKDSIINVPLVTMILSLLRRIEICVVNIKMLKTIFLQNWTISFKLLQGSLSSQVWNLLWYVYIPFFLVYKIAIIFIPQLRIPTQDENIKLICIQYLSCHLHISNPFNKFIINDWDDLIQFFNVWGDNPN